MLFFHRREKNKTDKLKSLISSEVDFKKLFNAE